MADYKRRIADQILSDKLDAMGAILIEGPKGCGKTTTAEQQAKSVLYMDDPDYSNLNFGMLYALKLTTEKMTDNLSLPARPFLPISNKYAIQAQEDMDGLQCAQ